MAFAGIFQPFARLRWIRFGLLMRAVNSRAAFPFRNTGKVFRTMGEGCGRPATGDARGAADEEARSRKASEGIRRKVTCSISTLSAASVAKYQMFRCDPVPYSDFSVSAS